MITVHGHGYVAGGPAEADGVPTCAACGLPDATPTTTHPDAVFRYGRPGQGRGASVPVAQLLGGQGRATRRDRSDWSPALHPAQARAGTLVGPDRDTHPEGPAGADGGQGATVPAHRGATPQRAPEDGT